jgi:hypothetical protein
MGSIMAKKKHSDRHVSQPETAPGSRNKEIRRMRVGDLEDAPWIFGTHGE